MVRVAGSLRWIGPPILFCLLAHLGLGGEALGAALLDSPEGSSASPGTDADDPCAPDLDVEIDVSIEGLDDEPAENVRASLAIVARPAATLTEQQIRALHRRAPEQIERALQPFGHFRPRIDSELEPPGDGRRNWLASYRIDPGPRARLERVHIELRGEGKDDPAFRSIVAAFPLAAGDAFYQPPYTALKDRLSGHAAEHGYFDAEFVRHQIRVDLDRDRADIDLVYDTGPRFRFGEVHFRSELLRPDFLQRFVPFEPGSPFELGPILELRQALGASPYFLAVDVEPRPELGSELAVPIEVDLVPAREYRWRLGGGYGTDRGARGRAAFDWRRVNRRGHTAHADLVASFVDQHLSLQYRVPKSNPRSDALVYELGYRTLDTDVASSDNAIAGASYTRAHRGWRETFGLHWRRSDFEVGTDRGTTGLLVPSAHWLRVDADDRVYATRGWRYELAARGSWEGLFADATFLQLEGSVATYQSLAPDFRVIGRLSAGTTLTDQFRQLPPRFRYFAGGDRSIRGFGYQSIGELDELGNVIGGKTLLLASLELESLFLHFERWGPAGAAIFWDAGSAAGSFADDLRHGVGFGLRWLSPIGVVGADVAWGVSEADPPVRFHLTIGPDL